MISLNGLHYVHIQYLISLMGTLSGVLQITAMEPPYGECNATNPTPFPNCQVDCQTHMIVEKCGCRDIYMRNLTDCKFNVQMMFRIVYMWEYHTLHLHSLLHFYSFSLWQANFIDNYKTVLVCFYCTCVLTKQTLNQTLYNLLLFLLLSNFFKLNTYCSILWLTLY